MKYRKKPVVIEAIQFRDDTGQKIVDWLESYTANFEMYKDFSGLEIVTLEGGMMAYPGDWIIRGIKGEFYPCKPDIFEATYEAVE